jgi:hypothetical protein
VLNKFRMFGSDARVCHIVNRERNKEKSIYPVQITREFNSKDYVKLLLCKKCGAYPTNLEVENMKFM